MKTIFFDLDDTLYFRRDAFYLAFEEFYKGKHQDCKALANDRSRFRGDEVFYQAQKGVISSEEMYRYRFTMGFQDAGLKISDEEAMHFYSLYRNNLYELKLNGDVISMLDYAKGHFENLGIITNGEGGHQRNKIENLGLKKWIKSELIVISGEHGCPKPDKKLFEIASEKSGKAFSDIIIIGDSFQNDIAPANELGMHTIWLNLYDEAFKAPEFEVKEIKEVPLLLQKLI